MLIAENNKWRIRCRTDRGDEDYALTMAEGRFTFYLHGRVEKVTFIKALQRIKKEVQKSGENFFFITFGGYFGIWLTLEDIEFILANLPMTKADKQVAILEEYDISKTTVSKH